MGKLHDELFEAYEALRRSPWTDHDAKMIRLWAAIDDLKNAALKNAAESVDQTPVVMGDTRHEFTLHLRHGWFVLFHTRCERYLDNMAPGVGVWFIHRVMVDHECPGPTDRS